jgi:pectate lyase
MLLRRLRLRVWLLRSLEVSALGSSLVLSACASSDRKPADATGGASAESGGSSNTGGGPAAQSGGSDSGSGGSAASGSSNLGGSPTGGVSGEECMTPPPEAPPLVGWATEGSGTIGGGDEPPVLVTSANDFTAMISGMDPRVIHFAGNISGSFAVGSNKTIIGVCDAQVRGHLGFNGSSNVIVRNLKIVGNNCADSPMDCSGGADAVGITGGSHHLWFDHLDVSDGSDGNLDVTQGSNFVTVSWTKFSYSTRRTDPDAGASGHRFSNLIGASDTDARDPGKLNVTYHHCWWADNIDQRMPRSRRGQIHVFNNLFTAVGNSYCTNAGFEAKLLVENNVYIGVNRPLDVSSGDMRAEGNVFQNTTGSSAASGVGFTPPYEYELDPTTDLEAAIRSGAGPH